MSKNLTRKGLAFGALVALGSSAIAGAPAFAADLSLVPSAGTTYSVLLGDTFTVNSSITGNTNAANTAALKWEVVNTSGVTVAVTGKQGTASAPSTTTETTTDTGTTKVYTPGAVTTTIGQVNQLTLDPTTDSTTATFSVTVRSFSDLDSSGSVTSGDLVSDIRTVTFVKGSEVTGTIALADVYAGSAPTATLSFNKDINVEQTTLPTAVFTVNGTAGTGVTAALNTGKTGFDLTHGSNAAASDIVSAKASWLSYDGDTTKVSATSSTKTAAAASDADTADVTLANSEDIATTTTVRRDTTYAGVDEYLEKAVRAGVKTVNLSVAFTKSSAAVAAGQPVTVTVRETGTSTLAAGTVITVGGKELKNAAGTQESVSYNAVTDASGKVAVAVVSDDATAGDSIEVLVAANGNVAQTTLTWDTAAATSLVALNGNLLNTKNYIAADGSVSVEYALYDQFGKLFTKTDYNYRVALTRAAGAITLTNPYATISGGKASASIVENDPASANFTVNADVEYQTGTAAWATVGLADAVTEVVVQSTRHAAATISLADAVLGSNAAIATTGVPAADKDLVAYDSRKVNVGSALGLTAANGAKIVGTVKQADGSLALGVPVTISAADVAFSTDATGSAVVSLGSITVQTDASNGTYTVYAFSKKAGAITITNTSGAATKTQSITWASAAADAGSALTISAAATSAPGRTVPVVVTLVDKYGNAVDTATADGKLTVTVSGVGTTTTIADHSDASGKISFNVILASGDSGTVTVTAKYDSNGATADVTGTTVVLSQTATITVAAAAVVEATSKIGTANSRVYVNVKDGKGSVVSVKIGAKWFTRSALNNDYTLSFKAVAKKKVSVKVYVDGDLSSSKTIVVKK